ncbi:hypothetical protein [Paenarthrobacter sp. 2TAF44]|uniref:hypothetical protein n=1 Tax=Paenarthrobacter sp. 2TAF44 TaxID=3233018 RepID=UPI003F96A389
MSALEIHGQADRFNVRPLEDICFTIVCRGTSSFRSQLLRVERYSGDAAIPLLETTPVTSSIDAHTERRLHAMCVRPFLEVPGSEDALSGASGVTLGARIRPDVPEAAYQGVLTACDTTTNRGIGIFLRDQRLTLLVGDGHAKLEISLPEPLQPGNWYEIATSYDQTTGLAALFQRPYTSSTQSPRGAGRGSRTITGHRKLAHLPEVPLILGASAKYISGWTAAEESFIGTIEAPYVSAKSPPATDLWGLHARRPTTPDLVAAWDFSQELSADGLHIDQIPDIVGSFHAHCVNAPIRAVPGHRGSLAGGLGTTPESYGAIHLLERRPDPERWKSRIVLPVPQTP